MYKLYGNNRGMRLLDMSEDETDILDTLGTYIGCLDTIDYIVIENIENYDNVKEVIHSLDDYVEYKQRIDSEYRERTKRRSR